MKAYSTDLRERVAAACQQGDRTIGEVATQFSVSDSFVRKLRRCQRTSGSVAALPQRSGPAPFLNATAQAHLMACLRQEPDATLAELCVWLVAIGGPAVSQTTLWRAVQALDWWRKKSVHATERDTQRVKDLAPGLCRGAASGRCYLLQVRGRDQHQPDVLPPLCPGRRRAARAPGHTAARRAERDAGGRPDLARAASDHDRERGRQRRRVCGLPGPGARPHVAARRRRRARQPARPQSGQSGRTGGGPRRSPAVPAAVFAPL